MTYPSTKAAVGHYIATHSGPARRQPKDNDGIQRSYVDADAPLEHGVIPDHTHVGRAIVTLGLSDDDKAELFAWATKPDDKDERGNKKPKPPPPPVAMRLARLLRDAGLITEPVRPVKGGRVEFETLHVTTAELVSLPIHARAVLAAMRSSADDAGVVSASVKALARAAGYSRPQTTRAIRVLCEARIARPLHDPNLGTGQEWQIRPPEGDGEGGGEILSHWATDPSA